MTPTAQEVPGETEWQKKFRHVTAGESVNAVETAIKTLLNDGSETSLRLEMNRKAGDMTLTVSVGGKAGSTMAAAIRDLGKARSATLGLRTKDAAMSGELNFSLSDQLREVIGAGFEAGEGFYGFGSGARVSSIRASGAADRPDYSSVEMSGQLNFSLEGALWKAIGAAFNVGGGKVLLPTLKAAEHYGAFTLQGPGSDGLYTFVAGIQVKDGARLEETFRETVSTDSRTGVTIDIEKVGSVGIHRVGLTPVHDDARAVFGDGPLYFAFRDDTLLVAAGVNGLDILKEALAAAPVMGRLMELQMAIAKLAPLAGDKEAVEIAREVFRDDKDGDRLRLTLEGGDALKLQLSMKTKLIEYANRVGQAKK